MTKAIIIADGQGTRWNNYLDKPKHLIEIDGERLIDRTVRLLIDKGIKDIHVVGPNKEYKVEGAELYRATQNPRNGDIDKFMNSSELWNKDGRTIVLYGDVYFTEDAIRSIVDYSEVDFALHCRPFNSQVTGTTYGECFAISFFNQHRKELESAFESIKDAFRKDEITRMGGWEVYKFFMMRRGRYPKNLLNEHWLTEANLNAINDWTDDFDWPEDYDRFIQKRKDAGL